LKITFNDGLESPKLENKSLSSRTPKPSPLDDRHREDDVKPKKKDSIPQIVKKISRTFSKKKLLEMYNNNNDAEEEKHDRHTHVEYMNSPRLDRRTHVDYSNSPRLDRRTHVDYTNSPRSDRHNHVEFTNSPRQLNSRRLGSRFEKVEANIKNGEEMLKDEDAIDERAKWDWGINIWSEENNTDKYLRMIPSDNDYVVAAGTFNELVKYLTTSLDVEYSKTFLLTYKSFAPPRILLKKLLERYKCDNCKEEFIPLIQTKCLGFLVNWIEENFSDFSPVMVKVTQEFAEYIRIDNTTVAAKLEQVLGNQLVGLSLKPKRQFENSPPPSKIPKDINKMDILSLDSKEVARQLTLLDWEIFENLKSSEFLNKAWSHPILKQKAENVLKMIHRFNDLSKWTIYSILNYPVLKKRAKVYSKFVDIAYDLYEMNNFNGAIAISSGLNNSAIYRLKNTKEKASKSAMMTTKFETLISLMDTQHSYKNYRDALTNCAGACIPHLGVFLQDLTFIEDGNEDIIDDNLINFAKRRMIYKSILTIRQFQQSPYNLYSADCIQDYLNLHIDNSSKISEEEMFAISRKLEPKETGRSR
jgi:hypothetical protein